MRTAFDTIRYREDEENWRARAACANTDPEAFFPDLGGATQPAKDICAGCPVAAQCLATAIENREEFGIWGGVAAKNLKRKWRAA